MKYYIVLFLFLFSFSAFSQQGNTQRKLVQVSGIISDLDSNSVVPYVTVTNLSKGMSISADYRGYYSFIANPGDTILFTAIGYKNVQSVIPANVQEDKYTLMVKMKAEIVIIKAVRIYPWATVEDFTRSFLALKIADDDMALAKKNLSSKSLRAMGLTLPRDAGEITSINSRLEHDRALNKNMVQTNPLLNPFAWGRLMQSIMKGDKSRAEDN